MSDQIASHPTVKPKLMVAARRLPKAALLRHQLGMLDQYKKHFTLREGERNSYQIMFTTEGAGKITYLDKTIELGPNQICVINKYKYHYYETAKCGHWKYYHLSVSGDSLKQFCDLLYNGGFSAIDITDPDKAMKYWQKIWNLVKAGTLSANIKASLTAYEFLTYILELKLFPAKQPGAKHNFMDTMAVIDNYITDHLNEKITLADLARISYLSPRHLSRKFESQMGHDAP